MTQQLTPDTTQLLDRDNRTWGVGPMYLLYQQPRTLTTTTGPQFDLFNASGSGKVVRVVGIWPMVQVTAASAIVPSFEFSIIRTSAVGTGGTAHTYGGTATPSAGTLNIAPVDSTNAALPSQVTARSLPTGGATSAQYLLSAWLVSEETNAGTYLLQNYNLLPGPDRDQGIIFNTGEGIKVSQVTATASTGTNYGWLVRFVLL